MILFLVQAWFYISITLPSDNIGSLYPVKEVNMNDFLKTFEE